MCSGKAIGDRCDQRVISFGKDSKGCFERAVDDKSTCSKESAVIAALLFPHTSVHVTAQAGVGISGTESLQQSLLSVLFCVRRPMIPPYCRLVLVTRILISSSQELTSFRRRAAIHPSRQLSSLCRSISAPVLLTATYRDDRNFVHVIALALALWSCALLYGVGSRKTKRWCWRYVL